MFDELIKRREAKPAKDLHPCAVPELDSTAEGKPVPMSSGSATDMSDHLTTSGRQDPAQLDEIAVVCRLCGTTGKYPNHHIVYCKVCRGANQTR